VASIEHSEMRDGWGRSLGNPTPGASRRTLPFQGRDKKLRQVREIGEILGVFNLNLGHELRPEQARHV
jgi:hypothetical protein